MGGTERRSRRNLISGCLSLRPRLFVSAQSSRKREERGVKCFLINSSPCFCVCANVCMSMTHRTPSCGERLETLPVVHRKQDKDVKIKMFKGSSSPACPPPSSQHSLGIILYLHNDVEKRRKTTVPLFLCKEKRLKGQTH